MCGVWGGTGTGGGGAGARRASWDRDLTVKGSRHLTFNITVKLTIKEEMSNLTWRQKYSFTQARPDWQEALVIFFAKVVFLAKVVYLRMNQRAAPAKQAHTTQR